MHLFSYVVTRDYGFAPNPFPPYCTLATCKPGIREAAEIGDWVIGSGSEAKGSTLKGKLIYAMQVERKISFDDYWNDVTYQYKKPIMNGSLRQMYGDNIYHWDESASNYVQENSHHSYSNGIVNPYNFKRDLKSKHVLISETYWYWGRNAIEIPSQFWSLLKKGVGFKRIDGDSEAGDLIYKFIAWVKSFPSRGYIGRPLQFGNGFSRYNGK